MIKLSITYCESRLTSRVHVGDDVIVGGDVNVRIKHAIKMAAIFTTAAVLFLLLEYKSSTMSVHATSNPH